MNLNFDYLSIILLVVGALLTLFAAYQLYKKGFLIWMLLAMVGMTAINFGLNQQGAEIDDFLDELNAGTLSRFSQNKLKEACDQLYLSP